MKQHIPGEVKVMLRQIGRQRLIGAALIVLVAVVLASTSWALPVLGQIERAFFDWRYVETAPAAEKQNQQIVLVTYNEDTVVETGQRTPLDRNVLARAIPLIDAMKPKAIAVNLLFTQPQPEDEELLEALRQATSPLYLAFMTRAADPRMIDAGQENYLRSIFRAAGTSQLRPLDPRLMADRDGVIRKWPNQNAGLPPTLVWALLGGTVNSNSGTIIFKRPRNDLDTVFIEIPIQFLARFPQAVRGMVTGKYVLVGGSLSPENDVVTPLSRVLERPTRATEVHAQMLAQALEKRSFVVLPAWFIGFAAALIVFSGACTGLMDRYGWRVLAAIGVQVAAILGIPLLLQANGVDTYGLPALGWVLGWLLALLTVSSATRAIGSEQRRFAQSALGRYLPPDVANQIIRDPTKLELSGEQREVYALFTDLEGFTQFSHAVSPRQMSSLLNAYLDCMSEVVLRHGGTIDKFVGDAVVAFWGAPIAYPDDGRRAVAAAVALRKAGEAFQQKVRGSLPRFGDTRVGLHRGEAVVGNFGGNGRMQYTALGDGMNTAARLESANKLLKTGVLISTAAIADADDHFLRPMGRVVLSGRSTPIELWEPTTSIPQEECRLLRRAWADFDAGEEAAMRAIKKIAKRHPEDAALALFVYRLKAVGPGGAFVLASK